MMRLRIRVMLSFIGKFDSKLIKFTNKDKIAHIPTNPAFLLFTFIWSICIIIKLWMYEYNYFTRAAGNHFDKP